MKYFVIPWSERLRAAPSMIVYKVKEAYLLIGKPAPEIIEKNGRVAIALFSYDPEVEGAIKRAADLVLGSQYQTTEDSEKMLQWIDYRTD